MVPGGGRQERVHVRPRVQVERARLSYLQEHGWTAHGDAYRGRYRTKRGSWWGEAKVVDGQLEFFIHDPPKDVLSGPHGQCFRHLGDNWWIVHFWKRPANPSDGILALERTLQHPNDE